MHIGKNIKILRKKAGINQTELGEKIGVSKAAISGYESGNSIPGLETFVKLAYVFDVSADDLLFRDIEKEGTSGAPAPRPAETEDHRLLRLNELLENRVRELEREIKLDNPELAGKLGIR